MLFPAVTPCCAIGNNSSELRLVIYMIPSRKEEGFTVFCTYNSFSYLVERVVPARMQDIFFSLAFAFAFETIRAPRLLKLKRLRNPLKDTNRTGYFFNLTNCFFLTQ